MLLLVRLLKFQLWDYLIFIKENLKNKQDKKAFTQLLTIKEWMLIANRVFFGLLPSPTSALPHTLTIKLITSSVSQAY